MRAAHGGYDLLLTELKAAAIDVVATLGEESGIPTVLCDNVPISVDKDVDLSEAVRQTAEAAIARGQARSQEESAR